MAGLNKAIIIGTAAALILPMSFGLAFAAQPQMESSLHKLEAAQSELQKVTQNKAGHAAAARKLVAEAIEEVQAGIAYGRTHGD
ncbi:hypothetical protein [Acidisphaera sp. S103]|uniref:hypothetical protein n=1 Tax=Acidisphaera sp. S103 TaxID=1747223 RepID=UPI00131CF4FE|nr:hypothetical protein [Acidisphaera sp. S103]